MLHKNLLLCKILGFETCCIVFILMSRELRKLDDTDLARGPDEVFTIVSKIGRG